MADHYYTKQPGSKSKPETFEVYLNKHKLKLISDSGVFSKGRIDYGSKVLIEALSQENFVDGSLLDIGCGYGPIGLSLALENEHKEVHMVDVNERAVGLSRENAELNKILNVKIYQSSLYENVDNNNFAAIASNPPIRAGKQTVHAVLEEAYNYLTQGGKLYIVIQKKQGAPSAKKKMGKVFGNVERIALDKGYWVLMSEK